MPRKFLRVAGVSLFLFFLMISVTLGVAAMFNGRTYPHIDLGKSLLLTRPVRPLSEEVVLRVVTFNIHDLYIVAGNRPARMRAIGQILTELDPDIVGIQESFIRRDRNILLDALTDSRLAYHNYFRSGTVGCGLLVLSAFPIVETFFHRFEDNGKWYKLHHGDWWAGKGVALARLALPQGIIDFYNTHAHSAYGSTRYDGVQKSQMAALADFMLESSLAKAPALLVGDMNCRPGSPQYEIAVAGAALERLMNIYSRIDHIFGRLCGFYEFEVIGTESITGTAAGRRRTTPLSDHPGYISTVRVVPTAPALEAAAAYDAAKPARGVATTGYAGTPVPEPV